MERIRTWMPGLVATLVLLRVAVVAELPTRVNGPERQALAVARSMAALGQVDAALSRRDVSAAAYAWHDAYVAALWSRHWESLLEVGAAYLRIGDAWGSRVHSLPKARSIFLDALFCARQAGAVDGVLRVAEQFAALRDEEVPRAALRLAAGMAGGDPTVSHRIQALADRWIQTPKP
jgi:hypothetical protein